MRPVGERAPHLLPGDNPFVAVADGLALHVGGVGPGFGLRKGERAQVLTPCGGPHLLEPHLVVPAFEELLAARNQAGDAHPGAGQLLGDEGVLENSQPEAAVLLGDEDAEEADIGELVTQRHRNLAGNRIQLVRDGQDFLARELPGQLPDGDLIVGQLHRQAPLAAGIDEWPRCGPRRSTGVRLHKRTVHRGLPSTPSGGPQSVESYARSRVGGRNPRRTR